MSKGVLVHFLVPRRSKAGQIEYQIETKELRLPLKRRDRRQLRERLDNE